MNFFFKVLSFFANGLSEALFGTKRRTYSMREYRLTDYDMEHLISTHLVRGLTPEEEKAVETALMGARRSNGLISLQHIDDELYKAVREHKIDKYDRERLMVVFKKYFEEHSYETEYK